MVYPMVAEVIWLFYGMNISYLMIFYPNNMIAWDTIHGSYRVHAPFFLYVLLPALISVGVFHDDKITEILTLLKQKGL